MNARDLAAARKAATKRFLAVAAALKAEAGITEHVIRKSLSGLAYVASRRIVAPEGRTRKQLYILAHEVGHVALGHKPSQPRHLKEAEAEQWAHAALRRHGVAVPRIMTQRAKKHVAHKIEQAERRGAKHIAPKARRFAK